MSEPSLKPYVAIACGGTGGHLFPGLAVGEALQIRGCDVGLLISPKEVDQQAVKSAVGMEVITLPAVALNRGGKLEFLRGFAGSYRAAKAAFAKRPPKAVLAMGGFTSAPPILAGKKFGAVTCFHESNSIPGKANRLLAHIVDEAFVGFASATNHLFMQRITTTGTPVRPQFQAADAAACRMAIGLDSRKPVLLVTGGSQGASGVNDLVLGAMPFLAKLVPDLQILHLTGSNDFERVRAAYAGASVKALVRPFLTEMELALGAATVVISRAGASSLAELAAMRAASILIPYPAAADDHQYFNAEALVKTGAARMLEQKSTTAEELADEVAELVADETERHALVRAMAAWDVPEAADRIADRIMALAGIAHSAPRGFGAFKPAPMGGMKPVGKLPLFSQPAGKPPQPLQVQATSR